MIKHAYSNAVADGTATTVVRPSDWNSAHVQQVSISGNTAGVSSFTARDVVFQGGNNLTLSASVAGSIATMLFSAADAAAALTHTHSQYLTTAAQSDHTHSQYLTTAAQSDHTHSQYLTTAAATNVTTNNMATAERGNYFYTSNNTFASSTHSHGAIAFSGTNVSGSFTSASNGLSIQLSASAGGGGGAALSAGTQSANTGTIAFANSNGITFGMSGSNQITAAHNGLTTAAQSGHSHNLATTTTNGSQIIVATTNSLGATIAVPPFLTTAQAPGAYLTTARASNEGIGLNTALTANGVSATANSSGLSLNFPAFLTTAALSGDTTKYAGTSSGFTGGASISGSMTHNTAGLALSLSHPAWLTTAAQSSASNVSGVIAGTNATGGTATLSGNVSFSNANGVSFYTSAGNAVVASVKTDYLTTAMVSNAGSNFVGLNSGLTGNGVSATINSSGISLIPWPIESDSVEELHCSNFFEHVPAKLRKPFMEEVYRILKPGKSATFITPMGDRMSQDPTHEWPPIVPGSYLYFNQGWLTQNKLTHGDYVTTADFDYTYGYGLHPAVATRNAEYQQYAIQFYQNAASDLHVTLTKRVKDG